MRISDLARLSRMSPSAFHRNFRAITAMSPLQFQKRIRLQEARSLLAAHPGDVAGSGTSSGTTARPSSTGSTGACPAPRRARTPPACG
jgi:transcriptional regulator GlxA family with amidase domain